MDLLLQDSSFLELPVHERACNSLDYLGIFSNVFLASLGVVITCYLLAVLCDQHLDRVLHSFTKQYRIPEQVAGVTFLAVGGSLPELVIHILAVIDGSEIGVASIFGSGIYNLTFGFALTSFFTRIDKRFGVEGNTVQIKSLLRDSSMYLLAVVLLFLFNRDDQITLSESIVMISCYPVYILLVVYTQDSTFRASIAQEEANDEEREALNKEWKSPDVEDNQGDGESHASPAYRIHRFTSYPFRKWFEWTIPSSKYLHTAFLICLFYVVLFAFIIMRLIQRIGCVVHVDAAILGMIFVSIGTSLPDTILMVTEARKGHASMSLSGLVGSNIFDVLLGLGFPWILSNLLNGPVVIQSRNVLKGFVFLGVSIIVLFLTLKISSFQIRWYSGILPLVAYIVYVVIETT